MICLANHLLLIEYNDYAKYKYGNKLNTIFPKILTL